MTRQHVYAPPPHLEAAFHTHTCPRCSREYACYGPLHQHNTPRLCGSTGCRS